MPVIGRLVPVDGDADLDLVCHEEFAELCRQPDPIGMDPEVKVAAAVQRPAQFGNDAPQPVRAR